jgi:arginyl-tRNA synthetase
MTVAQRIKEAIAYALSSFAKEDIAPSEIRIEHPADLKNGDYSSSAPLYFAKKLGRPAPALADIIENTEPIEGVEKIEVAGPGFINFYLNSATLAESLNKARSEDMWGSNATLKGKKIMVEYTDPNPFKEFHIGHLMSNAIGESISRLLQFSGAEVKRANYQGDVGPHVAKAIWGVLKLGADSHDSAQLGKAYATGAQGMKATSR